MALDLSDNAKPVRVASVLIPPLVGDHWELGALPFMLGNL